MDDWNDFFHGDDGEDDIDRDDHDEGDIDLDDDNDYALCGPSITDPPADGMTGNSYCEARTSKRGAKCCHVTNLEYNDSVRETIEDMQEDYEPGTKSYEALDQALTDPSGESYNCFTSRSLSSISFYQDENGHIDYSFWGTEVSLDLVCPEEFESLISVAPEVEPIESV